ncbi:MAG: ABC transporter permease [Candidatus Sumerlaeaceae bacterium]
MTRPFRQQLELVLSLAKRDLKARYKDSVLGFFWSLLRPAFLTFILWVVFYKILPNQFGGLPVPYWMHVLVGVLAWNFFLGALTDATHSLTINANLLKKVRLDAEVFPISAILANGVHFALAMLLVLVLLLVSGIGFHWELLLLPVIIALEALLVLGAALYLSSLNVYYRDVGSALELGGMALFYITPVIYPLTTAYAKLHEKLGPMWAAAYMLNPVAPILVGVRRVTLYHGGSVEISDARLLLFLGIAAVVATALTVTGWLLFRRLARDFADEL